MDHFTRMPIEIKLCIWDYIVRPQDIEDLASVNRSIRVSATKILERHKDRSKNFGHLSIGPSLLTSTSVSCLLQSRQQNPCVLLYIREIELVGCSWDFEFGYIGPPGPPARLEDLNHDEKLLYREAGKVIRPMELDVWTMKMVAGMKEPLAALLLLRCPNVQALHVNMTKGKVLPNLPQLMDGIGYISRTPLVLPFLHRVSIDFDHHFYDANIDAFGYISHIASIFCLNSIKASGAFGLRKPLTYVPLPKESDVKSLDFQNSAVPIDELDILLRGLKSLQEFRYSPAGFNPEALSRGVLYFDPSGICRSLLAHAQGSLKVLHLRDHSSRRKMGEVSSIPSLRGFTVLKTLCVSLNLLLPPLCGQSHFELLATNAPSCVQEIHIWMTQSLDTSFPSICDILVALSKAKASRLLDLSSCTLDFGRPLWEYELQLCTELATHFGRTGLAIKVEIDSSLDSGQEGIGF